MWHILVAGKGNELNEVRGDRSMGMKVKGLRVWWMVSLLSVVTLAAASSNLLLLDAVKEGDTV